MYVLLLFVVVVVVVCCLYYYVICLMLYGDDGCKILMCTQNTLAEHVSQIADRSMEENQTSLYCIVNK